MQNDNGHRPEPGPSVPAAIGWLREPGSAGETGQSATRILLPVAKQPNGNPQKGYREPGYVPDEALLREHGISGYVVAKGYKVVDLDVKTNPNTCLLYTSPSPRDS